MLPMSIFPFGHLGVGNGVNLVGRPLPGVAALPWEASRGGPSGAANPISARPWGDSRPVPGGWGQDINPFHARAGSLEQIRDGWKRRRRSTDTVNLLYPFDVDRSPCVRWNRAAVQPDNDPIADAPPERTGHRDCHARNTRQ